MNIEFTEDDLITFLNFTTAMATEKDTLSRIDAPDFEMSEYELIEPTLDIINSIIDVARNAGIEII